MTAKEIILQQMAANFDNANWFVTIKEALNKLSEEQSFESDSSNHNIREIVNHLIFWNERYLKRFKGDELRKLDGENSESFTNEWAETSSMNLESLKDKLYVVLNEWKLVITASNEAKLTGPISKDRDESWYSLLSNINIHNSYHIGQIVTLRKQQGNWISTD